MLSIEAMQQIAAEQRYIRMEIAFDHLPLFQQGVFVYRGEPLPAEIWLVRAEWSNTRLCLDVVLGALEFEPVTGPYFKDAPLRERPAFQMIGPADYVAPRVEPAYTPDQMIPGYEDVVSMFSMWARRTLTEAFCARTGADPADVEILTWTDDRTGDVRRSVVFRDPDVEAKLAGSG